MRCKNMIHMAVPQRVSFGTFVERCGFVKNIGNTSKSKIEHIVPHYSRCLNAKVRFFWAAVATTIVLLCFLHLLPFLMIQGPFLVGEKLGPIQATSCVKRPAQARNV